MLPTASYRCDISSKGAVLLAGAMTRRWAAQTRYQRWNRGQKARGQGHKKISRSKPRKDPLEAKDTDASVLKKKVLQKIFSGEKGLQKIFFRRSVLEETKKKVFADFPQSFWRFPTKFQRFKNSAVLEPRAGQFSRT